jgi:hypothetical protein
MEMTVARHKSAVDRGIETWENEGGKTASVVVAPEGAELRAAPHDRPAPTTWVAPADRTDT